MLAEAIVFVGFFAGIRRSLIKEQHRLRLATKFGKSRSGQDVQRESCARPDQSYHFAGISFGGSAAPKPLLQLRAMVISSGGDGGPSYLTPNHRPTQAFSTGFDRFGRGRLVAGGACVQSLDRGHHGLAMCVQRCRGTFAIAAADRINECNPPRQSLL